MDGKIKDMFEKITRYIRPPFRSNDITDEVLEKTGGRGLYAKHEIDLSIANSDRDIPISGDNLTVEDCPDAVTVKLNHRKNPEIDLQKLPEIEGPFKHLFINNEAGSGTLKFFTGDKGMFRAKKKLEIINQADYIIYKDGSHTVAIKGENGETLSRNTDSSTVIQAAIDAITSGGVIYVKPGTYTINTTIAILKANQNIKIIGAGSGTYHETGATIFLQGASTTIISAISTSGSRIYGIEISGIKFLESASYSGKAINFKYCIGIKIMDCSFRNIDQEAVLLESVWISTVQRCDFKDCGNVANTDATIEITNVGADDSTSARVINCTLQACRYRGMYINAGGSHIALNYFESDNTGPTTEFIKAVSTGCTITKNYLRDKATTQTTDAIMSNGINCIINSNTIWGCQNGVVTENQPCTGTVISNNSITQSEIYGIKSQSSDQVLIIGNNINECGNSTVEGGIYLAGKAHVIANTIIDSECRAMRVSGASGAVIKNNIIREENNSGDQDYGIHCSNGANNNIIEDNVIEDCVTAYMTGMGAATVVKNNSGYITEASGASGGIADGGTIAHGLSATPTHAVISGSVAGEIVNVTGLGAANLTIAIKTNAGAAGTNQVIYWRAWV